MDIQDIIRYEGESTSVNFKKTAYKSETFYDFCKDVLAMANAPVAGDRYLIVGVKYPVGRWFFRCLLSAGLMLPARTFAQQLPWPREATSGRIVFAGVLPWPTSTLTQSQQQALVRRWYLAKLSPPKPPKFARRNTSLTTFAGLPTLAYLDSLTYEPGSSGVIDSVYDWSLWCLLYRVHLAPTPEGLAYRLSDFQCAEVVYDASSSEALETVLLRYGPEQAVFYRRLRRALSGW